MRALKNLVLARWLAICLAVCAGAAPTAAVGQSSPELRLPEDLDETLRQLMDQLKPAMKEMFRLMDTFEGIDDPRHYQMPEVLPNGDIIIRRRGDAPPFAPRDRGAPRDGDPPDTDPLDTDPTTKT